MPYSFETGPDGKIKTIFTGKVYDGPIDPSVAKPRGSAATQVTREAARRGGSVSNPFDVIDAIINPRTPSNDVLGLGVFTNKRIAPLIGLPMTAATSLYATGRALTGPKTGDFQKDVKAGMQRYAKTLEAPLLGANRVVYNAMFPGLLTSVSNLAQGASRRPGQPDSPLFGILPPPPKAKSTGAIEDFLTSTTQWVGAAAATYLGGRALMGVAPIAGAVGAISRLPGIAQVAGAPATLRTMASATQGIGGVSGGLRAGAKLLEAAGQGAIPGFVADVVAFTPGERTTASTAIDFAKQNAQAKATLDWVNNSAPALRPLLQQVVLSSPGDNDVVARLKEGILGLGVGAAAGTAIESAALAGRAVMSQWRAASKVQARAAAADVAAAAPTPAGQQTVDVTATTVQPTPAAIAPAAPAPTPAAPVAPRQQARVDVAQDRVDAVNNKLTVLGEAPPKPSSEKKRFGPAGAAGADPAAVAQWKAEKQAYDRWRRQWLKLSKEKTAADNALVAARAEEPGAAAPAPEVAAEPAAAPAQAPIPDPWEEFTQAQAATARAVEDAGNKLTIAANTVPDPMGPVGSDRRGNWLPTYSQVREESVADIATDPQQLQYKAEGRGAATGETQALAGAEAYNPVVGGWISVWRNPADNKLYVVNGHNRLALAKRSGIEKIPVWEIQAGSAAEARTIGAIENIASNKGTAIDAATTFRDAGLTVEELQARGVDFNVEIANQGLALSRLPMDVFAKVANGTLSIDKALALGSQPLLDPVVKSIAKEAAKADVDADQIRATVQQAKEIEAAVINPEVLPPGAEIPVAGAPSKTPIADALRGTLRAMAESDARLFREIEGITKLTREAINLAGGEAAPVAKGKGKIKGKQGALPAAGAEVPAPGTLEPAAPAPDVTRVPLVDETTEGAAAPLLTRDVVIPESAVRKLSPGRVELVSEIISDWLKISTDEARNLLLAKNQVLDVDKIPGVNLDKAMNDKVMGMTTPETQVIAQAYEQFYGPSSRQQQIELLSIGKAFGDHMPPEKLEALKVDPVVMAQVKELMVNTVRKVAGDDIAITFNEGIVRGMGVKAHGMEGKPVIRKGGYGTNINAMLIDGDPLQELITFNGMAFKDYPAQTIEEYAASKLMTAAHEAFHAVQHRYLSSRELAVLDNTVARIRLAQAEMTKPGAQTIETSAQAFGGYYLGQETNVDRTLAMIGVTPNNVNHVKELMQSSNGIDQLMGRFGAGFFESLKIIDKLLSFTEKLWNAIRGRGWTSIDDIFAQAAAGDFKNLGRQRGHVWDIQDMPSKVNDYVKNVEGTSDEWARRVRALDKLGSERAGTVKAVAIQEGLMSDVPDVTPPAEPPRGIPGVPGPEDPEWQQRFARVYRENAEKLAAGEITREELLMLSHFQKTESPSGRPYTAKSEELAPGLAAMSQVLPDRPTESGIPVMNVADVVKQNQEWFNSHGLDKNAILAGLDSVTRGFAGHEHGALNRAMFYADHLQVAAQVEAGKWLNGGADADLATLNSMIAAADKARRMHKAVMEVTRPWGQLGVEMQMGRDYTVPAIAGEAPPVRPGEPPVESVVDQQLGRALADGDSRPDGIYEDFTDLVDPALTEALKTGEMTVEAQAAADDIATFLVAGGVDPSLRVKTFERLADIVQSNPEVAGKRINGNSPLRMVMINNVLSAGTTASGNFVNGGLRAYLGMGTQAVGAMLEGDTSRAFYAMAAIGRMTTQIDNAFRLAAEALRAGEPLTSMRSLGVGNFDSLAARDHQGQMINGEMRPSSGVRYNQTGWTVRSMDLADDFARSTAGQVANAAWQLVATSASRAALTIDTFNSTLAGHAYEWFRHMPRGMDLAVEQGMEKYSKEAWNYASQYAEARLHQSLKDAIIDGRTITDAILDSPEAQKFIRAMNATEDMVVNLDPRTLGEGMRLGMARGLKDQDLVDFAKQYVEEGDWKYKAARVFMDGMDVRFWPFNTLARTPRVGRWASAAGALQDVIIEKDIPFAANALKTVNMFMHFGTNNGKNFLRMVPGANLMVDSWWRDFASEDPAARQRAIGEIAIGTGVAVLLTLATQFGRFRLNGAGPADPLLAEQWTNLEGRMPYSIQYWDDSINGWSRAYPLNMFEPYATLFGAWADFNDLSARVPAEQRKRMGGDLLRMLVEMQAKGILNKTYFQGIRNLYEAAFDPNKSFTGPSARDPFARFLQRLVATMEPASSAMRAARRQIDPVRRSVEPSQTGNAIFDFWNDTVSEIRNQTPGFSGDLPPHRDWTLPGSPPMMLPQVLGTDIVPEDQPFLIGAMQFAPWSSIRVNEPVLDPVKREMAKHFHRGAVFYGPRAADFQVPGGRLTPSELSRYQQIFGSVRDEAGKTWHQTVTEIINAPDYNVKGQDEPGPNGEPSFQAMRIQAEISRFKELAKEEFMATPGKGAQITAAVQTRQERQRRFNEQQRYGIPGAPQPASGGTSMTNFIEEMNR